MPLLFAIVSTSWLGDLDSNQDSRSQSPTLYIDLQKFFSQLRRKAAMQHQCVALDCPTKSVAPTGGAANAIAAQTLVDDLFRAVPSASGPTTTPTANNLNANVVRGEMNRLFTRSLRKGSDFSPADRTYVAQVVAARTGLSQADAEKRVTEVTNQAKAATDAARKGAAKLSLWLAASMLAGAFAASLAATEGGKYRDGGWYDR